MAKLVLRNNNYYAFTFRNGNTLTYKLINKDANNGHSYLVEDKTGRLYWIGKMYVTKVKKAKGGTLV